MTPTIDYLRRYDSEAAAITDLAPRGFWSANQGWDAARTLETDVYTVDGTETVTDETGAASEHEIRTVLPYTYIWLTGLPGPIDTELRDTSMLVAEGSLNAILYSRIPAEDLGRYQAIRTPVGWGE